MKSFSQKFKSLAQNTLWFVLGTVGSKLISFFLMPLYTSILSTSDYGVIDLVTTTNTVLSYILTLSIADAVLRFVIERPAEGQGICAYGFRTVLRGGLVLLVGIAVCWAIGLFQWPSYCYIFLLLEYVLIGCNNVALSHLRATDRVRDVAVAGVLASFVTMSMIVLLLTVFRMGTVGYLIGSCLGTAVSCVYSLSRMRIPLGTFFQKPKVGEHTKKDMLKYSTPLILNGVSWWINSGLDKYFLAFFCGTAGNGLYAAAGKLPGLLSMVHGVFAQAWTLSAIQDCEDNDKDGFFATTYSIYGSLLAICCCCLILLNIPLATLLFAKDFFHAWEASSILMLSTLFNAMCGILSGAIAKEKQNGILAKTTVIAAVVNITLNYLLIPRVGIQGAAIATAVSFWFMWLLRFLKARKMMNLKLPVGRDLAVHALLVVQIVAEHTKSHLYGVQVVILALVLLLYRKQVAQMVTVVLNLAKKMLRRNAL